MHDECDSVVLMCCPHDVGPSQPALLASPGTGHCASVGH